MEPPPIVSPHEWETARQQLLVEEKKPTRARDAMAAKRRWSRGWRSTRSTGSTA